MCLNHFRWLLPLLFSPHLCLLCFHLFLFPQLQAALAKVASSKLRPLFVPKTFRATWASITGSATAKSVKLADFVEFGLEHHALVNAPAASEQ